MQLEEFDIEFLAQKMSESPRSMLFARLADLYLVKEQNAEAMKLLEEGIPNFPTYYAAYIVLGKAHLAFKEYSRASAAFSKALELSPFNQTAAQLLAAVPNKPDESTRTTDENYFAPPAAASAVTPATPHPVSLEPEPEPVAAMPSYESPVQDTFDMQSLEEPEIPQQTVFDPFAAAIEAAAAASAAASAAQTYGAEPEQPLDQQPDESFPTYDEYFAQNQHRINVDTPIRLDDYLRGDAPAVTTEAPVIEEMPQHEFVNESYVEPEATPFTPFSPKPAEQSAEPSAETPEPHFDPEPVFSSPEQAQLFAEMTGMDEPPVSSSATDLDSLTQKLQSAEKIVPEENYQPKTPTPQETSEEKAYETDAVTPTLAEIYASQGEYRAAIQAYEILMFSQPAKGGEFQQRIRELQQLQMEKDGLI